MRLLARSAAQGKNPAVAAMACGATLKRQLDFEPLLSPSSQSPKRRRCTPLSPPSPTSSGKYLQAEPTPSLAESHSYHLHSPAAAARLTPEQVLANLKQEYSRMQRRLQVDGPPDAHAGDSASMQSGPASPTSVSGDGGRREQPLFTLRQVGLICDGLLREREVHIRQEYDQILSTKLAEQYEGFVKFTQDQIMRKYGERPASYVS